MACEANASIPAFKMTKKKKLWRGQNAKNPQLYGNAWYEGYIAPIGPRSFEIRSTEIQYFPTGNKNTFLSCNTSKKSQPLNSACKRDPCVVFFFSYVWLSVCASVCLSFFPYSNSILNRQQKKWKRTTLTRKTATEKCGKSSVKIMGMPVFKPAIKSFEKKKKTCCIGNNLAEEATPCEGKMAKKNKWSHQKCGRLWHDDTTSTTIMQKTTVLLSRLNRITSVYLAPEEWMIVNKGQCVSSPTKKGKGWYFLTWTI